MQTVPEAARSLGILIHYYLPITNSGPQLRFHVNLKDGRIKLSASSIEKPEKLHRALVRE